MSKVKKFRFRCEMCKRSSRSKNKNETICGPCKQKKNIKQH